MHQRLVVLAARAELVVASVDLDRHRQFQRARRAAREALNADGVAREIDETVDELMADSSVPDLMTVLSGAAPTKTPSTPVRGQGSQVQDAPGAAESA